MTDGMSHLPCGQAVNENHNPPSYAGENRVSRSDKDRIN